ncbi:MAG: Asp-tRNA(Asn)/Glu-tRNA(Gln) amidotransferase subunit GatB [Candidatus Omnitrophota bacterium]
MNYETVIGLEVHVQLKTKSKIFCGCKTDFGAAPNTQVCPVCLGFPGSLPVLNQEALALGAKAAVSLNCKIAEKIRFDRKNYFYPDIPKAYQISQFSQPLSHNGFINILSGDKEKRIGITRAHLEEDTGKLFHQKDYSLVDFNRSGTPLLEIVSEPEISSPDEAYDYLTALKAILEYIKISDCNMEEASLRCDANISIREQGAKELGTKTEIKNMNSFKAVKLALEYERDRQIEMIKEGGRIVQETRLYNAERGITESMRSKEEAHDYRYFPEPDLVPFDIDKGLLENIKKSIPELPEPRKNRFIKDYGLSEYDASLMVSDKALADYYERCVAIYRKPKDIANWLMGDIASYMSTTNLTIDKLPLKEEHLTGMIKLIDEDKITGKIAKTLFIEIIETQKAPEQLVKEKGLEQIQDAGQIEKEIEVIIKENPKSVNDFKNGKENAVMFLVGKVMAKTKGRANPKKANEILREKLKGAI